jgi:hypothetical protein
LGKKRRKRRRRGQGVFGAKMMENKEAAAAREALERQQYVLGMMEDGFQEGYKMGLQGGWSNKGFDDGFEDTGGN